MGRVSHNYCLDCDWSASIEDHDRHELAALAIEHTTERGHDIDSKFSEQCESE